MKLKKGPGSYGKALAEVLEAERDHTQRSLELDALRRRHRPPSSHLESELEKIALAEKEAEAIVKLEQELQERSAKIEKLWVDAGAMADEVGRLGGTDDDISNQIEALEQRLRHLRGTFEGQFREDAWEQVNASLAVYRAAFEQQATRPDWRQVDRLVQAYVVGCDPRFAEALHDAVDARTDFAPGTRADYRLQVDRIGRELTRRRHELALRAEESAVVEAEHARVAAAHRLAALEAQPVTH